MKKLTKILIIFISALILFLAGVFGAAIFVKNKLSDTKFLENFLYKKYGLTLNCDKINAGYSGMSFTLNSPYISIGGGNSAESFIEIQDFSIKLKILPLLLKEISLSELFAKEVSVNLNRQKDGTIDFLKYIKFNTGSLFSFNLSKSLISIPKYSLNFNDEFIKNKFELNGYSLFARGLDINSEFSIATNGVFSAGEKVSPYLIDLDYTKKGESLKLNKHEILLYSIDFSSFEKYFEKFGFSKLNAKLDIASSAQNNNFKTVFYLENLDTAFNYKGGINTLKSMRPLINETVFNFSDGNLVIESGHFMGNKIDVYYSGKIKSVFNFKEIEPELKIKISDSSIEEILKIAPDTLFPFQEPYVKNMKMFGVGGIVNGGADVRFKNREDFSVRGELNFYDVYIGTRPKNAKTSFGKCIFKGRDVDIEVYANAPNDAAITVFGKSKLQKMPDCEFKVNSFGKIDMAFAQTILNPLQKILGLKLGPLPYMELEGEGEISLKTSGNKIKSKLYGEFQTDNAKVKLQGLNARLTGGKVKVIFDGSDISFKGATGVVDGAPLQLDGVADTSGNMDITANVQNIPAKNAMYIAETSPIVTNALGGGEFLKSFKPNSGNIDFNLNLSGNVPPDAVFGEQSDSILAKGEIIFKGVNLTIEPQIKASNVKGVLNFENSADFNLSADIYNSPFKIKGSVAQKGARGKVLAGVPSALDINFISDKINSKSVGEFVLDNLILFAPENRLFAQNLAKVFNSNDFYLAANVSARGNVESNSTELDLSGFDFDGSVTGLNNKGSSVIFKGGNISLKGKNAAFNKLSLNAGGIDLFMDGVINKFASNKPYNNLKIIFYNSPFSAYVDIFKKALGEERRKLFDNFKDFKGEISGNIKLSGDKIAGEFTPNGISLFDNRANVAIRLNEGKIKLKNDKTYLGALTLLYGDLPLYCDGFIQNTETVNPEFNIYFSTNVSEENCDKLINPYMNYPVSITGETLIKARISGNFETYTGYLTLVLNEGCDLSFMGLKFGDINTKREIASKVNFKGKRADINYIRYFKYINSQNNKQTPYDIIKISGGVNLRNGEVLFDNLRFVTPNPAPVRFLNPMFKKSIIKNGLFTSNLVLNGAPANVGITGNVEFSNVFVPAYDSFIDDIKIKLDKNNGRAEFSLTSFNTKADIVLDFVNKTSLPLRIKNISIHSDNVAINNLMQAFTTFADSAQKANSSSGAAQNNLITPSDILIEHGNLNVDKILFNEVEAANLKLNFSHSKDTSLKIDDAYLAIAGGLIKGSGAYKFDTKDVTVSSDFINCDANELTKAFFNLQGQIYGNANGKFTLNMSDFSPGDYLNKINADAEFEILNGKLPKLGSIEYLLRASNFFKSGLFGLTINNVIELLTPYKHGDFNKISGNFKINEAEIKDLKIYSQGENLSTYTYGSYNIPKGEADIEILGKLSKNISNLLGPIGNASVVSVLNVVTRNKMDEFVKTEAMKNVSKIPLMDLSNDNFRLFNVKLTGPLSTDDVVKSFNWLN